MQHLSVRQFAVALAFTLLFGCGDAPSSPGEDAPPEIPDVAWLDEAALPFDTAAATGEYADLMPLVEWIGDARVVALGEATHGTREFFLMKHRLLEFLNAELGFDVFAIEATFPESRRVNRYVRTGDGDAAELLAGLYFWTWNTEEVLDMIEWMRERNASPGEAPPVSFFGFDMQYPRVAMDDVVAYLEGVDPGAADEARDAYACYRGYQNNPPGSDEWWAGDYEAAPDTVKASCRAGVTAVHDTLAERRDEYASDSSAEEYEWALRSARVVVQNEELRRGDPSPGYSVRDAHMAENAAWLLEQAGPDSKIVLWAHNRHIWEYGGFMGAFLREEYGPELVTVGFAFHHGSFNAVRTGAGGQSYGLGPQELGPPVEGSYEHYFGRSGLPRFVLDVRPLSTATSGTEGWLRGPQEFRQYGCCYRVGRRGFSDIRLAVAFDLVIYFEEMRPSRLLPFPHR